MPRLGGKCIMIDRNIDLLRKEIKQWRHLTIRKLEKLGYFYSDAISILELYKPEDVCNVLNQDYNLDVDFIELNGQYIIFCAKNFCTKNNSELIKLGNMFNKHFDTNGVFRRE